MDKREIETIVRQILTAGGEGGAASAGRNFLSEAADLRTEAAENKDKEDKEQKTPAQGAVGQPSVALTEANGGLVQTAMPLALAVKLIGQVEAKAAEWNMRVVTAVSDPSGRPVAVHCMDGAYAGSFDVALNKTYTSIAFQMSTAELGNLSQPGMSLYGIQFTNGGRIVIFGGGELLKRDGVIVGALGVSGGSAAQDTELAAYGRMIFEEVVKCL